MGTRSKRNADGDPRSGSGAGDARKGLIRFIHAAKRELALEDDSYRDLLARATDGKKRSCTVMTRRQLNAVADEMRRLGAGRKKRRGPKRAGTRPIAIGEQASKIRALWLSLYHLAEIEDSSEAALARFVERKTGIEALQWLGQHEANKIIKALRGWCRRVGFQEPMARRVREIDAARQAAGRPKGGHGFAAKVVLIELQIARLLEAGFTEEDWPRLGWNILKPWPQLPTIDLRLPDVFIERLGKELRRRKAESDG